MEKAVKLFLCCSKIIIINNPGICELWFGDGSLCKSERFSAFYSWKNVADNKVHV